MHAPGGVTNGTTATDLERLVDETRRSVPDMAVRSPLDPGGDAQINGDGTVAFAELDDFHPTSEARFELGGDLSFEDSEFSSEGFGMIAAIVILLFAFGSVLALGLPILTALFGVACGFAIVSVATNVMDIPYFTPAAVAMIGIGVGIGRCHRRCRPGSR